MSIPAKKNPALEPLSILIGKWRTIGKHPMLPNVILKGQTTFKWLEQGAFLVMYSHIDHKDFPDGIAIFGSDDSEKEFSMNYYDERKVSRKFTSTFKKNVLKWWRDDKKFSQHFIGKIQNNGNTIVSKGKMSRNGKAWEKDLELTFTRIKK